MRKGLAMGGRRARLVWLSWGSLLLLPACHSSTEIVSVVDTNLTKYDIDEVTITDHRLTTAAAHRPQPDRTERPDVSATLGLEPTGASGNVQVTVVGLFQSNPVVTQTAATTFVEGSQKMLRVSSRCAQRPLRPTMPTSDRNAGSCQPANISGDSLPSWTDVIPAPPPPSATVPIGGRTIWADGWHSCANEGSQLYCWGQNSDGEIGDGTQRNANSRHLVMGVSNPAAVGLGALTSCICHCSGKGLVLGTERRRGAWARQPVG